MVKLILSLVLCVQLAHAEQITIYTEVSLHRRPSTRARSLLAITAGETAELLAETDGWIKVRVRGKVGWLPQDSIVEVIAEEPAKATIDLAALAPLEPDPEPPAEEPAEEENPDPPRTLEIEVGAGLTVMTQGFRTTATDENYNLGVTAATLALGVGYTHRIDDKILLGAELAYAYHKALPGIRSTDPETGDPITTAFAIHDASLRFVFEYDLARIVLLARGGLQYHSFQIADVDDEVANPSRMPSEIRLAPTLGVGLAIPHVTPRLGLRFVTDGFFATTTQTPGQEDGVKADARGLDVETALTYRWHPRLDVRVTYTLGIAATDFGAPDPMSARTHAGTSVARFDVAHGVTVGIAKGF